MVLRRRGAVVVTLCVGALSLVACGTQVDGDPPITVGPTAPTEATDPAEDTDRPDAAGSTAPTATPPAAEARTGPGASSAGPSVPAADGTVGSAAATAGSRTFDGDTDGDSTAGSSPSATGSPSTTGGVSVTPPGPDETTSEPGGVDPTAPLPGFAAPGDLLTRDPTGAVHLLLDELRLGLHDGYDRVVLDLSGTGEVGWRAEYVANPALDGSGIPVDLAGPAVLVVSALGMAYPEPGDPVYDDGLLLVDAGGLQVVTEVLGATPLEGQLQVYVGVAAEAPFRVFRLSGPERLVIDIQH